MIILLAFYVATLGLAEAVENLIEIGRPSFAAIATTMIGVLTAITLSWS